MGYPARLVGGSALKFREGHAWLPFEKEGKLFLLEPRRLNLGGKMPRISTLTCRPETSVAWDGKQISYYVHEKRNTDPPFSRLSALVGEGIPLRGRLWNRAIPRIPLALARRIFGHKA